jgi:hypothetical protein
VLPIFQYPGNGPANGWKCTQSGGWARPYGNVAPTLAGVKTCAENCRSGGYVFFGFECPQKDQVHCQCSQTGTTGSNKPTSSCAPSYSPRQGVAHCIGPFRVGPKNPFNLHPGHLSCTSSNKCTACEGDCNSDIDCVGNLLCQQRSGYEAVPGCAGTGTSGYDYCYDPDAAANPQATYDMGSYGYGSIYDVNPRGMVLMQPPPALTSYPGASSLLTNWNNGGTAWNDRVYTWYNLGIFQRPLFQYKVPGGTAGRGRVGGPCWGEHLCRAQLTRSLAFS